MKQQIMDYKEIGKNKLLVPQNMCDNAIQLDCCTKVSISIKEPFNKLYSLWKPSHFYTGLEIHSHDYSWRTFRLNDNTLTGVKMYVSGNKMIGEVYSEKALSEEQIQNIKAIISRAYGLDEVYNIPENIVATNTYVNKIYSTFYGTRISCPENLFEISIVSLLLQNTNISRTTTMFNNLIRYYGKLLLFDGMALFAFYAPQDFYEATEQELKDKCRLGYRAKYIINYSEFFTKHKEEELRTLGKEELLDLLKTIKGVGPYTSNIVASSALRDKKAIPFDAWNRKILAKRLYDIDPDNIEMLREKIINDFGEYSGLMAMYVIENEYKDNPVVPLLD